jgi:hypothetical protein
LVRFDGSLQFRSDTEVILGRRRTVVPNGVGIPVVELGTRLWEGDFQ